MSKKKKEQRIEIDFDRKIQGLLTQVLIEHTNDFVHSCDQASHQNINISDRRNCAQRKRCKASRCNKLLKKMCTNGNVTEQDFIHRKKKYSAKSNWKQKREWM